MTQTQFVQEVVNAYDQARNITSPYQQGRNIQRCRSHSVSSVAEDILATYVYDLVQNKGYSIYVDCPITIPANNGGKAKTYYPDIVVCNKTNNCCEIKYLINLKMDVGWFRNNIGQMVAEHDNVIGLLSKASSAKLPIHFTDNKGARINVTLSSTLRYDIAIITAANGSKYYFSNVSSANALNLKSRIYTLTTGDHPIVPSPNVRPHSEFTDFDNYCKNL